MRRRRFIAKGVLTDVKTPCFILWGLVYGFCLVLSDCLVDNKGVLAKPKSPVFMVILGCKIFIFLYTIGYCMLEKNQFKRR